MRSVRSSNSALNAAPSSVSAAVSRQQPALREGGDVGGPLLLVVVTTDRHELRRRSARRRSGARSPRGRRFRPPSALRHARRRGARAATWRRATAWPTGRRATATRCWRRTAPGLPMAPTRRRAEPARRRRRRRRRRETRRSAATEPSSARRQRRFGRGKAPGVGQRPGDPRRGEVVEQRRHDLRPDGAERRRPPGEVAHPETLVAGVAEGSDRLRTEVGDGVDQLEPLPDLAGECRVARHLTSLSRTATCNGSDVLFRDDHVDPHAHLLGRPTADRASSAMCSDGRPSNMPSRVRLVDLRVVEQMACTRRQGRGTGGENSRPFTTRCPDVRRHAAARTARAGRPTGPCSDRRPR